MAKKAPSKQSKKAMAAVATKAMQSIPTGQALNPSTPIGPGSDFNKLFANPTDEENQ